MSEALCSAPNTLLRGSAQDTLHTDLWFRGFTMPAHIMLSYQWDNQALVKKVYERLSEHGLLVWMDIEGGVTGNINDS